MAVTLPPYADIGYAREAASAVLGYATNKAHAVHGAEVLLQIGLSFWQPDSQPIPMTAQAATPMGKAEALSEVKALAAPTGASAGVAGVNWLKLLAAAKLLLDLLLSGGL